MFPTLHPGGVSQELLNHVAQSQFLVDPIVFCYAVGISIAVISWTFGVLLDRKLGVGAKRSMGGTTREVSSRRAGRRRQLRISTHG